MMTDIEHTSHSKIIRIKEIKLIEHLSNQNDARIKEILEVKIDG